MAFWQSIVEAIAPGRDRGLQNLVDHKIPLLGTIRLHRSLEVNQPWALANQLSNTEGSQVTLM